MNNLNEQVNKRVIFDNDEYGVYLPYNLASICSLVPNWCEDTKMKDRTLDSFKQQGVLYLVNNKKDKIWYILQDEGSRVPLQKSGKYKMYQPQMSGYIYGDQVSAKKYFSQSKELRDVLNLNYTVNEMLKYGIPFTPEEMKEYSEETPFAKVIYEIIQGERGRFALEKFTGRDDIEIIEDALSPYEDIANGAVAIHPRHDGVTFYMEAEYFKEKILNLTEDDDWVYNSAMNIHGYGSDCEEMDYDEMNYVGNYLTQENMQGYNDIMTIMGFEPITDFGGDEGDIVDFLEKYFPKESERMEADWLYSLGCAIGRGRAKGVREYIGNEILFEYEEHGRMTEMFIAWPSLLRVVGKNKLENFEDIVDMELNDIGNLYDMWYDVWDVDDEGHKEMNDDFSRMLETIKGENLDNIKVLAKIRGNTDKFETQVISQFDFIPENNYRSSSAKSYKLRNPIPHPHGKVTHDNPEVGGPDTKIYIKEWSPDTGEIMFFSTEYGHHSKENQRRMDIDEFIKFLHNLKNNPEIPFPEEEKEVNENHTTQIINNIVNNIIQENTKKY